MSIALVYPELLGTYGDRGNAMVLAQRLTWRGVENEVVEVAAGAPVPSSCDIYVLGGGEDDPQVAAADHLRADGGLARAVERGATLLAVCAGYQIVGATFETTSGEHHRGLELLAVRSVRGRETRAVGEVLVESELFPFLPPMSGYENHAGHSTREGDLVALGRVRAGVGNGDGTDGAVRGRTVATYMHGPVLARNPDLADLLLRNVVRDLPPLDDSVSEELRRDRRRAARRWRRSRG